MSTRVTHRELEPVGEPHQALRLAVALGPRHAEIVLDARIGVVALLLAHDHDAAAVQPAEPADDGEVLAEGAVAGERRVVGDQPVDVALGVRALDMARHLDPLPRRQLGVGRAQQPLHLVLQAHDFVGDVYIAGVGQVPELGNLAFQLRDRLLEIEIRRHSRSGVARLPVPVNRPGGRVGGAPADACPAPGRATSRPARACRFASWRCRHGRA